MMLSGTGFLVALLSWIGLIVGVVVVFAAGYACGLFDLFHFGPR